MRYSERNIIFSVIGRRSLFGLLWLLFLLMIIFTGEAMAQSCDSTVPAYTIDMTGTPDSVWNSGNVSRDGLCCGNTGSTRCIYFSVTLDTMAEGISVDVAGGLGSTYFTVGCSTSTLLGDTMCVTGIGPHEITICKPGGNLQDYSIRSIMKPHNTPNAVVTYASCPQLIWAKGLDKSTISWAVLDTPSYSSFLSCTTGCDSVYVTLPSSGPSPPYLDLRVTGYRTSICDTTLFVDTVRASFVAVPQVQILPANPQVCPGDTTTRIYAVGNNGAPPYTFSWSSGHTTDSVDLGTGTYIVTLTDSLGCSQPTDTVTITNFPGVSISAGNDTTICEGDPVSLNGSVQYAPGLVWDGGSGIFSPDSVSPNAEYLPTAAEISAGFIDLTATSTGNIPCLHQSDSIRVFINPKPATTPINH